MSKYPGLKQVAPDLLDPSLPIIELENQDELDNFMKGLSSAELYGKEAEKGSAYGGSALSEE
ncbi:MAG: hypothetical protein IKZ82_11950 [Clostridia bacterium]|nr:hypothetical protein [Clostridia bacterium]